jgi:hypothetical protein
MNRIYLLLFIPVFACSSKNSTKNKLITPNSTSHNSTNSKYEFDYAADPKAYKNGDILFITCQSDLSSPISLATKSKYTHCAAFIEMKDGPYIFEASADVGLTPFKEFMESRVGSLLLVMRLKNRKEGLGDSKEADFLTKALAWRGKQYDGSFMWSNESMYCSELVYKMYENVGIELCPKKKLKDFDFSATEVKAELQKRYGNNIPYDEPVVAPIDLIHSALLDTVYYHE